MALGDIRIALRYRLRRLEHRGLVGELAEEVRELHEEGFAVDAFLEDLRERRARLAEIGLVGEQRRHDLAGERRLGVQLEEQRGAFERRPEGARSNRRLDGAACDLRALELAGEAMAERERPAG